MSLIVSGVASATTPASSTSATQAGVANFTQEIWVDKGRARSASDASSHCTGSPNSTNVFALNRCISTTINGSILATHCNSSGLFVKQFLDGACTTPFDKDIPIVYKVGVCWKSGVGTKSSPINGLILPLLVGTPSSTSDATTTYYLKTVCGLEKTRV